MIKTEELRNQRIVLGSQCEALDFKIKMAENSEQINNFDIKEVAVHFANGGTFTMTLHGVEIKRLKETLLEILTKRVEK